METIPVLKLAEFGKVVGQFKNIAAAQDEMKHPILRPLKVANAKCKSGFKWKFAECKKAGDELIIFALKNQNQLTVNQISKITASGHTTIRSIQSMSSKTAKDFRRKVWATDTPEHIEWRKLTGAEIGTIDPSLSGRDLVRSYLSKVKSASATEVSKGVDMCIVSASRILQSMMHDQQVYRTESSGSGSGAMQWSLEPPCGLGHIKKVHDMFAKHFGVNAK